MYCLHSSQNPPHLGLGPLSSLITFYPSFTLNQFPLSSTHIMTQTIPHPLLSSLVTHTHSSKKIRARKLAHPLSPSCHSSVLTSCSPGLRLQHQHMQRALYYCLTFTTTSCSAYCTSDIPFLSLPSTPKTHARTGIVTCSQPITFIIQHTQK
jgi:hypothetical protein